MPIRYHCPACRQFLSIATRMSGLVVHCPTCGAETVVPAQDETLGQTVEQQGADERHDWEERASSSSPADVVSAPPGPLVFSQAPPEGFPAQEEPVAPKPNRGGGVRLRSRPYDSEEMDLTPMVDMTFLLLIFFMITASFSLQKTIEVPPPSPDQKGASQSFQTLDELESNSVIVRIDDQNVIYVDDQPVTDRIKLPQTLRGSMRSTSRSELVLTADNNAFHETVIAVIDAANEVGMQKIRLASRAPSP